MTPLESTFACESTTACIVSFYIYPLVECYLPAATAVPRSLKDGTLISHAAGAKEALGKTKRTSSFYCCCSTFDFGLMPGS